jgi:hypothetical protein
MPPLKGRSLSLFFFLKRKENWEPLRGSEKEAKNIARSKEFRRGCAGLFFAAAKKAKSANLAYSSQQRSRPSPIEGEKTFCKVNLPECTVSGGLWEEWKVDQVHQEQSGVDRVCRRPDGEEGRLPHQRGKDSQM